MENATTSAAMARSARTGNASFLVRKARLLVRASVSTYRPTVFIVESAKMPVMQEKYAHKENALFLVKKVIQTAQEVV